MTDVLPPDLGLGPLADEWFERAGGIPMTKAPTRGVVISLLSPLAGKRVLEIGSGTGGMTVELLRAVGESGRVTSLEPSGEAAALAAQNVRRSGLEARAHLLCGAAPEAIPTGAWDSVFVGGHGGDLERVLSACWERLELAGRLMLTAVSPGTTTRALAWFEGAGVSPGFWRLSASVGRRAGHDWLLAACNPVDVIWGDKE